MTDPSSLLARLRARAPWAFRPGFLLTAFAALALAGLAGMAVGYVLTKRAVPYYVRISVIDPAAMRIRAALGIPERVQWREIQAQGGFVEIAAIPISPAGDPYPAAVEELDGNLLVMTMAGDFFYLTPSQQLRSADFAAPMNRENLGDMAREWEFGWNLFRAHDLLALPAGPQAYDLYASFDRYTGDCFEIAVARIRVTASDAGLSADGGWEDVFVAEPCFAPRDDQGRAFSGLQGAGRLAMLDEDTLLVSLGDVYLDGSEGRPDAAQNPDWDYGKIVAVSLTDRRTERFATGVRNPQGLMVDSQGRIWESEHGPMGGDEVNLIRRGANYGWPLVTYGMPYTGPGSPHTRFGQHDDYERPVAAFTPAIGPSQLLEPSAEHFPFWRASILLSSLRNESIYVLRLEGDDIVYAEPVFVDGRIRDIIARASGELAMVTEEHSGGGHIVLLRAKREGAPREGFAIADRRTRPVRAGAAPAATPAERGRALYQQACASCHSVSGAPGVGPPLDGVVGRDIAGVDGFAYSPALSEARGAWTPRRLRGFLVRPEADFAGSRMPPAGLTPDQADDVVAYLRSTQ